MSNLVANRDGGKTDEYATNVVPQRLITGEVMEGLLVAANASPDMGVRVQPGSMRIPTGTAPSNYWYEAIVDTALPGAGLTATTANASNPRRDLVVAYIDKSITPSTGVTNNSNNMLKLAIVAGTAAASPVDPNSTQIQSAIGSGNPYIILARLRISAAMTQITSAQIDDLRTLAGINPSQVLASGSLSYTPSMTNWAQGTGGGASLIGKYSRNGNRVDYYVESTLGTTGSAVGPGTSFTLPPIAPASFLADNAKIGELYLAAGGSPYPGEILKLGTSGVFKIFLDDTGAASQYVGYSNNASTVPANFVAGDKFIVTGSYLCA